MIQKIKQNISQFEFTEFGSLVYLVNLHDKNIIIDTGSEWNRNELIEDLKKSKLSPEKIDIVILTHNHFDHVGNIGIFKNAKIYASKLEFSDDEIFDIGELKIPEFEIIKTPGHSKGSFCILYNDVLFSGDTIFHNGGIGRMDLEGGSETDMKNSLEILRNIKFKILCPGH